MPKRQNGGAGAACEEEGRSMEKLGFADYGDEALFFGVRDGRDFVRMSQGMVI